MHLTRSDCFVLLIQIPRQSITVQWVWVAMLFGIHVGHLQQTRNIAIRAWPLPGTRDKAMWCEYSHEPLPI